MNTNENKAALWRNCVEQGLFNHIPNTMIKQVQGLFEMTVREYDNPELDLNMANKLFLKEFRVRITHLTGAPPVSFEDTEKEYKKLLEPVKPGDIDFTQEKDKPIENIDSIIEEKTKQREMEINSLFSEEHKNKVLGISTPTINQVLGESTVNNEQIYRMLQSQNKVLQTIVESQLKIIEILAKSKK